MATDGNVRFAERAGSSLIWRLRRRLLERAAELHGDQRAMKALLLPVDSEGVKGDDEECVDCADRGTAAAILDITTRMIREVEDAIRRLDTGGYGRCEECSRPIAAARLQALPFALRCRDCQETAESVGRVSSPLGRPRLW